MKEKCLNVLSTVAALIKQHKKVIIGMLIALVILIIVINLISNGGKPRKYEDKLKTAVKAFTSESKMKSALGDVIDPRGAAAWIEADQDGKEFKKEYKNIKKDSDEVEDLKKALKKYAESNDGQSFKVKGIKKPEKTSKNKKIYKLSATLVNEQYGSEVEIPIKVYFYKGKIIDIARKTNNKEESIFEAALTTYKSDKKSNDSKDED